jgi:hypothetical protein
MADAGDDLLHLQPPAAAGEDGLEMALASAATPSLSDGGKIAKYTDIAESIFSTSPPNVSHAKRFAEHGINDTL